MADILLSVGMQTGSAETKEFINQLKSVVSGLNSAGDIKAKVGLQIDPASISDIRNRISEISDTLRTSFSTVKLDNSGLDNFTSQLRQMREEMQSMSGRNGIYTEIAKENALDAYRASAQKAISDLKGAQTAIERINNEIRKGGGKAPAEYLSANSQFLRDYVSVASKLGDIENRIKTGTRSGISSEVSKITGTIESYNKLISTLSESTRKEYGLSSIQLPKYNLESIAQSADAIKKESEAVGTLNQEYAKHSADVEKAAEAETQKATVSSTLAGELNKETKASEAASNSAAADAASKKVSTQAFEDASRAVREYYNLLSKLNTNQSARSDLLLGESGWLSSSGKYAELATQLNAAKTAFDMLTSSEAKSGMTAQQQAALQEQMAAKAKEYARVSEEASNKAAEAEQKRAAAAEAAAQKQAAAEEKAAEKRAALAEKQAEKDREAAEKRAAAAERASERSIKAAQQEQNAREDMLRTAESQINKIEEMMRRTTYGSSNYRALDEMRSKYRAFANDLNKIDASKARSNLKQLGTEFERLSGQINRSYGGIQLFGGGLSMLYSRINYYLSLSNMIIQAVRSVKKMAQTTTELDTSLTQLQVVTGSSGKSIREYGLTAAQTAQEIGGSTKELIDSTTTFARLGYTLEESSTLSKYTNMLKNVGDIDTSVATDAITAILKAYDIDATQIESVMDKMVEVGNNFPISVSQIAEGMNNAGSALHAAGNSFEQSVALLTAANTTVQNISKSSTGLRTITARIRGTKLELDDLGESIETAKYQEALDILTKYKVQLTQNGQFRSTYDILKDIASVWKDLSSMEQANIAEQLAGNRQQNVFYSIIEQFSEAEKAMTAMQNSTGALTSAYANFADSIQGKLNTFKATFDELAQNFTKSELLKEIIDFGTTLLNIANSAVKLTDSLGGLKTVLIAIAGIIAASKAESIIGLLSRMTAIIPRITSAFTGMGRSFKTFFDMTRSGSTALMDMTRTSEYALSAARTSLIGITALATALSAVLNAIENARAKRMDVYSKTIENNAQNYAEAESLYDLYEAYSVAKDSINDTVEARDALAKASSDLTGYLQDEYQVVVSLESSYKRLTLEKLNEAKATQQAKVLSAEKLLLEASENRGSFSLLKGYENEALLKDLYTFIKIPPFGSEQEKIDSIISGYQDLIDKRDELIKTRGEHGSLNDYYGDMLSRVLSVIAYLDPYIKSVDNLRTELSDIEGSIDNIKNDTVASAKNESDKLSERQREINNIAEALTPTVENGSQMRESMRAWLDSLNTEQLDRYTDAVMRGATSFAEANQIMRNVDLVSEYNRLNSNQYSDAFANVLKDIGAAAEEAGLDVDDFIMKFGDFNDATARNIRDLTSLEDELKNATEALKLYNDAISGENGEIASQYGNAYKKFLDDWNAGKTGTKAVRAAIELFLPDSVLKDLHYDMQKAGQLLASDMYQSIFNNENSSDYGLNFFNFLNENIKDLDAAGIEIKKVGDSFTFAYDSSAKLAYALGMSEDAVNALLDALDAYGVQTMMSREDTAKLAEELNLTQQNAKTSATELQRVANELAASGNTSLQVRQKMISLREGGFLNFDDEGIDDIISNAAEHFKIPEPEPITPEVDISSGLANVETLQGAISGLKGTTVDIGVNITGPGGLSRSNLFNGLLGKLGIGGLASGTKNASGGPTLVNELGPELISENGEAYIAGGGEPTIVDLDPGAVVLTAQETSKAMRGSKKRLAKSVHIGAARTGRAGSRLGVIDPRAYLKDIDGGGGKSSSFNIAALIDAAKAAADAAAKGDKGGQPKKEEEKEKQKFDWITIAIDRIQRAVSKLQKVASNTFKQLGTRLSASRKAVQEITKEIDIMQAGYERYLKEAESVGLDSGLAKLVREGTIDINEYDDDTRKLIQDYQKWYEKAIDCKDAIDDLHQSIAQLYLDNFNNAQKDFENKLSSIEHAANMIDQNIAMADARGYLESAKFYDALSGNTVSRINTLKSELSGLKKMFSEAMASGEIDAGSEAWYQMSESIAKVEEELASANVQLEEYKNKIREINWNYFDYAQSRIDQITDEAGFLIELMSNKELFNSNGGFSDYGTATLGMHVVGYETAMAKADEYAEELKRIERELANDPYDTALIERREELIGLQQKSILNAESEKNAVKDLVEEGIKKELDALRDLIDAYNDSLDSAKDLYEYQKKVAKQTEDIASLEKQLAAYQNDTSQENRARVQKLQQQLREARTTLQETERDKSISDQKKLLDDLYNDYEEHLNHRLDNIDALMEEMISVASVSRDEITQTIEEASGRVGYTITDGMRTVLGESFSSYNEMFDHVTGIHTQLSQIRDLIASIAAASGATKAYAKGGLIDYTGIAAVHGSPGNPEMVLSAADTARFLEAAALMRSAPKLSDLASSGVFTGSTAFSGTVINGLTISIPIDHVQDYNDMISQMQRDPKFDRLINAITLDRVAGKSQMGKYGVRF